MKSLMGSSRRSCYCRLWQTNPSFLRSQGVPQGYCGMCDRCGLPGHLRPAPPPVPSTAAWCDECFEIELHRGPNIESGAWHYDAITREQTSVPALDLGPVVLANLAGSLGSTRSSLIVGYPNTGHWVDLYVLSDGSIEMTYFDSGQNKWAHGKVRAASAVRAVLCGLAGDEVESVMRAQGEVLEYHPE